jgi:REP element-mobilizing transposase RayT
MGMDYRKTSHAVYDLKYHLVWITKYRKKVLSGQVAIRLRELIRQTCATLDVYIESGHVAVDHVHLLVSVPPQVSVSDLMQRLKGQSRRKMLEEFGELAEQTALVGEIGLDAGSRVPLEIQQREHQAHLGRSRIEASRSLVSKMRRLPCPLSKMVPAHVCFVHCRSRVVCLFLS